MSYLRLENYVMTLGHQEYQRTDLALVEYLDVGKQVTLDLLSRDDAVAVSISG